MKRDLLTSATASNSQLTFLANMTLVNQWTLKLPAGEAVHHHMTFDPKDSSYLYLMTSHHVSMWLLSLWWMGDRQSNNHAHQVFLTSLQLNTHIRYATISKN